MSSTFVKDESLRELFFRNVDGNKLRLLDKSARAKNVTKFVLYKDIRVNVNAILLFTIATLFLWISFNILIPFVASVLILILKLVSIVTAINKDTLTVVESVGIYTEGRRIFYGSCCNEFIPWDTVVDIFINEVIKGGIVLSYYYSEAIAWTKRFDKVSSLISRLNTGEKMPGIYVRKASWIDWTEKEEDLALTVPGSYWLCHKNNMYKFIFRYHRITRNVKKFNYGKELMKVIRRIIKSQPPQGQQFGTSHLLVTFGRTAWTRPDKMFAILQFKERSIRAYSHAFVLTIKMSDPSQLDENLHAGHDNDNKNDKRSKRCLIRSTKDDFLEKTNQNDNIRGQTISSELDNDIVDNSLENSANHESLEQLNNKESRNESNQNTDASFALPVLSENIQLHNECTESNDNCMKARGVIPNESSSEKVDEHNIEKNSVQYKDTSKRNTCLSSNSKLLNDCRTFEDTNVDSVNLPYQYLIEKEIENAKQNSENCGLKEISGSDCTIHTETNLDSTETEDSPCPKKKKYAPDNVARSSDITDLVMEGLMFTIRQGQDAVTVIEQKTKLEIDEVLENSEEIETEKGERRLRNSSLLGLENLITMIELPKENEHENKCRNVMIKDSKPLLNDVKRSLPSNEMGERIIAGTSFSNSDRNTSVTNNVNYTDIKAFEHDEEEEEEEDDVDEDIIPEALQNEIFQPSPIPLKADNYKRSLKDMLNKGLLIDGIEHKVFMKSKIAKNSLNPSLNETLQSRFCTKHDCSNNNLDTKSGEMFSSTVLNETHNDTVYQPNVSATKKDKSNVPVVISNQAITLNQIPLPLQKILKNKLSVKHTTSHNKDEKSKNNAEICNVSFKEKGEIIREQSGQLDHETFKEKDKIINEQLKSQVDNNISTSAQCLNNYQESIDHEKETHHEITLFDESKGGSEDTDILEKSIKLKNEESQEPNNCTEKVEKIPMDGIKDITEQFYQDLSDLQTKRNSMNQNYLRSRGKPSNLLKDDNDDEMHVQMVKFFHDITRGAKVVIRRIHINKYS